MGIFGFGNNNNTTPVDTTPRAVGQAYQNAQGQWEQEYEVWKNGSWVRELYIHNGTEWVVKPSLKVDITKRIPNTEAGINLKKSVISLDKSLISLEKKSGINFDGHKAKVAVVMDYSGSMSRLYKNGEVQRTLNRLMPLALRFDDNGELDVWIFDDNYHRLESMDLNNFESYVNEEIVRKGYRMGCTSYSPVLQDVLRKYFVEDASTSHIPTFVVFITDGSNDDKRATNEIIKESSYKNIFIQFVGIGNERFEYLERLDDLTGRPVDNTGFIKVQDMARLSDEQLFDMLLDQYPDWLKNKRI
jgi:hypothetical protein